MAMSTAPSDVLGAPPGAVAQEGATHAWQSLDLGPDSTPLSRNSVVLVPGIMSVAGGARAPIRVASLSLEGMSQQQQHVYVSIVYALVMYAGRIFQNCATWPNL